MQTIVHPSKQGCQQLATHCGKNPSDSPVLRPNGLPWICRKLHTAPLTLEARSIFDLLAHKATPDGDKWSAESTLDVIAEKRLRPSYPNASASRLRLKVSSAISELEHYNMIAVHRRPGHPNFYVLLDMKDWDFSLPFVGSENVRKGRSAEGDRTAIGVDCRSPDDRSLLNRKLLKRGKGKKAGENLETSQSEILAEADEPTLTPLVKVLNGLEDNNSAPPVLTHETQQHFDFSRFQPGENGSHPGYWNWVLQQVKRLQEKRRNAANPILSAEVYAQAMIANNGAAGFTTYLQTLERSPQKVPKSSISDELELACQRAFERNDRAFISARLHALCCDGLSKKAAQLCQRHPGWQFQIEAGEVVDAIDPEIPDEPDVDEVEYLDETELLGDFVRLSERGLQHNHPEDVCLGLAGLRTLWQQGCQSVVQTIRSWAVRWKTLCLTEHGPVWEA